MKLTAERTLGADVDRAEWDALVAASPTGSVYCLGWYLDVVAPGWEALCLRDDNGQLQAAMPLPLNHRRGAPRLLQPPLAQNLGPALRLPPAIGPRQLAQTHRLLRELVANLPANLSQVNFNTSAGLATALPFAWAGYGLSARYNYVIAQEGTLAQKPIQEFYFPDRRTPIAKAIKRGYAARFLEEPFSVLQALLRLPENQANFGNPSNVSTLLQLVKTATHLGMGWAWAAFSPVGEVGAMAWGIRFASRRYVFLANLKHPAHLENNAVSLAVHAAIAHCMENGRTFDFDGSMLPGVEPFFRSFGAMPEVYLNISRNRLALPSRH